MGFEWPAVGQWEDKVDGVGEDERKEGKCEPSLLIINLWEPQCDGGNRKIHLTKQQDKFAIYKRGTGIKPSLEGGKRG